MIKPLYDRVVLQANNAESTTASGLVLTSNVNEKANIATVVAVGTGRVLDSGKVTELFVKVGNKVLFSKFAGTDAKIDGVEYIIVREEDILGIIE
ncbi:MAG: co-chaperone GroES [Culicoidibacterales bacterium]